MAIFTIGHSTRAIDEFIEILRAYAIERIVDIRTMPRSRHNPQFNRESLSQFLRNRRVSYRYLGKLGGLRSTHADSVNMGWRNKSFRGYADYMQSREFQDGIEILIKLASEKRTAIMCAEAVPWRCHRSLVADALTVRGFVVMDLMGATSAKKHKLNPMAVVSNRTVTYPPQHAAL